LDEKEGIDAKSSMEVRYRVRASPIFVQSSLASLLLASLTLRP